jgi:hypothetical protein
MQLSTSDVGILAALRRGESPEVASVHRVRLELKGLVRDTVKGLVLTPLGRDAALSTPNIKHEVMEQPIRRLDAAGRKRMLERQTTFS